MEGIVPGECWGGVGWGVGRGCGGDNYGGYWSYRGGEKGQITEVLSHWEREKWQITVLCLCGMGEGADYCSYGRGKEGQTTVPIRGEGRGRLQKYCPYGRGKQGQTTVPIREREGADYRSTVPMGEGSRGRLLSLLGRRKGQTTEVLSLWEREAGADYCPY